MLDRIAVYRYVTLSCNLEGADRFAIYLSLLFFPDDGNAQTVVLLRDKLHKLAFSIAVL